MRLVLCVAAVASRAAADGVATGDDRMSGRQRRGWRRFFKQIKRDAAQACDNTCASARNGVCEDGGSVLADPPHVLGKGAGFPKEHMVRCDLGTDCADCGPRASMPGGTSAGPVERLRRAGVEVRASWTRTQPSFIMPYTDPAFDIDVSGQMHGGQTVEATSTLYKMSKKEVLLGPLAAAAARQSGAAGTIIQA